MKYKSGSIFEKAQMILQEKSCPECGCDPEHPKEGCDCDHKSTKLTEEELNVVFNKEKIKDKGAEVYTIRVNNIYVLAATLYNGTFTTFVNPKEHGINVQAPSKGIRELDNKQFKDKNQLIKLVQKHFAGRTKLTEALEVKKLGEHAKEQLIKDVNGIIDFIDGEMQGSGLSFDDAYNAWVFNESEGFIEEQLRAIIGESFKKLKESATSNQILIKAKDIAYDERNHDGESKDDVWKRVSRDEKKKSEYFDKARAELNESDDEEDEQEPTHRPGPGNQPG